MATEMYERLLDEALKLSPEEQRRLRDQLTKVIERAPIRHNTRRSSYGKYAHLGTAPSAEDIDDIRHEMWSTFPRDDVA